jgi:AbrB family looped-hinge helix DNA binding protein
MNSGDISVFGTVKVGERGQIVIPSEARKEFNIKPGDFLLVVSMPMKNGFAMIKTEAVEEMIKKMNAGLAGLSEGEKRHSSKKKK